MPTASDRPLREQSLLGRRRGFLLGRRYQIRAGLMISAVVLPLLVLLNWAVYSATASSTRSLVAVAPQFAESLLAGDRIQLYVMVGGSTLFLIAVFVFAILETHRTAGAELNLAQRLREVEAGRFVVTAKLRRGDNLGALELSFNRMVEALAARTREEIDELERVTAELDAMDEHPTLDAAANRLRELARRRRAALDPRRDNRQGRS